MPHDAMPQRHVRVAAAYADLQANRFRRAVERCAALLEHDPDDADALLLAGLASGALGEAEHAAAQLQRVAAARPDAAHPVCDLAALLRRIGQPALIEPQFRAALLLAPQDARLSAAFADFLHEAGRSSEAIPLLQVAVRLQPDVQAPRNLLAIALASVGRTAEAMECLRNAVTRTPAEAAIWANLGLLLKDDGRFDEALAAYEQAVALAPDNAQIRVNRVVALLRAGRWAEAWPDYEWRLTLAGGASPWLLPMLSAMPALEGRTVLVEHEDGFGDTLHFARYLPLLARRGAHVVARVPRALRRVMQTVPDVAVVRTLDDPLLEYDYRCPMFSLPRVFQTTPQTIPAPIPYLYADPIAAAGWARRLPRGRPRVGLVWAGQARPGLPGFAALDSRRSMRLEQMAPLAAVPHVAFISLQHGPEAVQARTPPDGMTVFDPMADVADFADTAAIIANLDLVISVDTAVVHLAGALGKPVYLLDRYDHCWRWLSGRADSPWYPSMRIFRQPQIGDWGPPLRDATAALATFAAALRAHSLRHAVGVDLLKVPETV
ncbi:MAG TPA: tetratricopeptide repeat protein [Acetobacteraceae bacterium]|jgi:tetratricopeptide (TPR) repeat protein